MNIAVKNIRSYLHFQQTEFALLLFFVKISQYWVLSNTTFKYK